MIGPRKCGAVAIVEMEEVSLWSKMKRIVYVWWRWDDIIKILSRSLKVAVAR